MVDIKVKTGDRETSVPKEQITEAIKEAYSKKIALILEPYKVPRRHPKYDWMLVETYEEFIKFIEGYYKLHSSLPALISFSHNLTAEHDKADASRSLSSPIFYSGYKTKTGKDAAEWLVKFCKSNNALLDSLVAIHAEMDKHISNIEYLINECKKQQGLKDLAFKMKWEWKESQ